MMQCMMKKAGPDSECTKCLKESMAGGGDKPEKVEFMVSFMDFKKEKDCQKGKKGKDGGQDKAYLGCNMQEDKTSMKISCPNKDGTLTLDFFASENCSGEALGQMVTKSGDCSEEMTEGKKPKKFYQSVKFELPEQCQKEVPEFFKTYDGSYEQYKAFCAKADEAGCKDCGGKMKKGACAVDKKPKCTKMGLDMCKV